MNNSPRLSWVCVNLEFGGIDYTPVAPLMRRIGAVDISRLNRLPELVMFAGYAPDIILFQEGRTYDANGSELLFYSERVLRRATGVNYRGFLARSDHNDLHQVVYINSARIEPVHHWSGTDPSEGARRYGWVEVIVDGDEKRSIMLKSLHWDPRDGDARLAHAKFVAAAVTGKQRAIWAGDCNANTSRRSKRRGEPQRRFLAQNPFDRYSKGFWPPRPRWWWSPRRKRLGDTTSDTRAVDYLIDTGWSDQHIADGNSTPTICPKVDRGGELIIDRCFTHGALRTVPGSVQVNQPRPELSDHRSFGGILTIEDDAEAA